VAYFLDWLVSAAALGLLTATAALVLLIASDLDRHDPPDWALAAAAVVLLAWIPSWYIYTSLSWALSGHTIGMRWARIRVTDACHAHLRLRRAALRSALLAAFSAPLLASPLLLVAGARYRLLESAPLVAVAVLLEAVSAAACLPPFLGFQRGAWHDLISGSQVDADSPGPASPSWTGSNLAGPHGSPNGPSPALGRGGRDGAATRPH
jgi:uncharacterized RDD family membrane protein YckC